MCTLNLPMAKTLAAVSPEDAEAALMTALAKSDLKGVTLQGYFEGRWVELLSMLDEGDELLLFETGGAQPRRGLAHKRHEQVLDVLVFP